jgi:hypothetical protein
MTKDTPILSSPGNGMEKYAISRELAERLKEAGYPQGTISSWGRFIPGDEYRLSATPSWTKDKDMATQADKLGIVWFAAPISDELLEQLPSKIEGVDASAWLHIVKTNNGPEVAYSDGSGLSHKDMPNMIDSLSLPNALAELWLWCKEKGYIAPTEKGAQHE